MQTNVKRYQYQPFTFPERTWPDRQIEKAPVWCSVDLRDGNQALINPMNIDKKIKLFKALVEMGFKEIEVGFPSASQIEFDYLRTLINENLIPEDVTVQVLTQAREDLIKRTMESIVGAKKAIVHVYNSTSVAQRKIVFKKSKEEIKQIAVNGVEWVKKYLTSEHQEITLQYSPESFTGTELDYSLEVCEKVIESWNYERGDKVIINLPATVELFGPQVYADMIEWFLANIKNREKIILSLHTHNDRGTGVAASELGLLAGADRIEGTLFGNGERTGNVDIVTIGLNLFMHGIDPQLDFSNLPAIVEVSNECTEIAVPLRHPYAGELVFTAFSGSHQDAIKKGLEYDKKMVEEAGKNLPLWEVPYLAINPRDIGRDYEAIIRINSQSGKGGIAYVLEHEYGLIIPRDLQIEFSRVIQAYADKKALEVSASELKRLFDETYLTEVGYCVYQAMRPNYINEDEVEMELDLMVEDKAKSVLTTVSGTGSGPIDSAKKAMTSLVGDFSILNYHEHALSKGSDAQAICYLQLEMKGVKRFGVGVHRNITVASIKAMLGGLNYFLKSRDN